MATLGKRLVTTPTRLDPSQSVPYPARYTAESRKYRPRSRPRQRTPFNSLRVYDKQVTALVVILLIVASVSLYAAYYLLVGATGRASRLLPGLVEMKEVSTSTPALSSVSPNARPDEDPPAPPLHGEKYLAYLPHSGFHNQRIALENALVLAQICNRTLLLPPVRLGIPLSYLPFDDLYEMSASASQPWVEYCEKTVFHDLELRPECDDYMSYTHISWDSLVDLSGVMQDQRILPGWAFTDIWLHDVLNISVEKDIFYLKDTTRNQYSYQDFFTFDPPARKFSESLHIAALAQRPERLIQLGTLFGSARLHLRSEANFLLRKRIRERMAFTNPQLARAAASIRAALGGAYLGVHLRIGDGIFQWNAPGNVRLAWWKLLHLALGFSNQDIFALELELFPKEDAQEPPTIAPDIPVLRSPHPPLSPFPANASPTAELQCRGPLHSDPRLRLLNAPLFIATDARNPALNPFLWRFVHTFPCSFFLGDFPEQMRALDTLRSDMDEVPLGPFLMPFLDAMVAGQAWQVVGTEQSTFSAFVSDVLWRTYHGFEIVQRG